MSKIALYHQHGREPVEMSVVKSYKDGTVDLAHLDSTEVIVAGCKVVEEAVPGFATLQGDKKAARAPRAGSATLESKEEAAEPAAEQEPEKEAGEEVQSEE